MLEVSPETAFHYINPTTPDSPRNDWDKAITHREILDQPHQVQNTSSIIYSRYPRLYIE